MPRSSTKGSSPVASTRCVYCDATLQPNSMFCLECGQLIPQSAKPPVPAQFSPGASPAAAAPQQKAPAAVSAVEPVPLPGTLPWQQRGTAQPEAPAAKPAAAVEVRPHLTRAELVFSTGQRVRISGNAVIGRKPAQTAQATGAQAIEVEDDTRSMSRVHLFLELHDGVLVVGDAGSSNGSGVQRNGVLVRLESGGSKVEVGPGVTVWVGDVNFVIHAA
jgi:hypothetical protein